MNRGIALLQQQRISINLLGTTIITPRLQQLAKMVVRLQIPGLQFHIVTQVGQRLFQTVFHHQQARHVHIRLRQVGPEHERAPQCRLGTLKPPQHRGDGPKVQPRFIIARGLAADPLKGNPGILKPVGLQ